MRDVRQSILGGQRHGYAQAGAFVGEVTCLRDAAASHGHLYAGCDGAGVRRACVSEKRVQEHFGTAILKVQCPTGTVRCGAADSTRPLFLSPCPKGSRAFLRIRSAKGRGVRLCWAHSKPKGSKGGTRMDARI